MLLDTDHTISQIVEADYRAEQVFKKYAINFCCSGGVSLKHACLIKNLDCGTILDELQEACRNIRIPSHLDYQGWKMDFLIDYITKVHHAYVYDTVPTLAEALRTFSESHAKNYPAVKPVSAMVEKLSALLVSHNRYEDQIIFPYIKQLDMAFRGKESYGNLFVRTLRKPLDQVTDEHQQIGRLLKELQSTSFHIAIPDNACTNYRVLFHKLQDLYSNLAEHTFLENNVLFPKAEAIEQQLLVL